MDEGAIRATGEDKSRRRIYSLTVNRPVTAALGWNAPSWLLDYGPVALVVLEGAAAIAFRPAGTGTAAAWLWLALVINATVLVLRHRAPMLALAAVLATTLALNYGPIVVLPTLLAVFTVAEYRDRGTVIVAALITGAAVIVALPLHGQPYGFRDMLGRLVPIGLAVAVGLFIRARADYVGGLQERAERLDRERELLARQAVGEERVRIARELHDVVAHNVSLMVVQAQALAATGVDDPEQKAALGALAGLGREALSEMHRMLGVLRPQNGGGPEREPQPGVRELSKLIERTGQAGLDATLEIKGEPRELPPAVDLSAYRIVQEALTNVVRHAGAEHVHVALAYGPSEVQVTVTDDGAGAKITNGSSGHGLLGMRERVALFGGQLETGPRPGATGYRVHASLPTG
jgi:signal transduction histidine kinase